MKTLWAVCLLLFILPFTFMLTGCGCGDDDDDSSDDDDDTAGDDDDDDSSEAPTVTSTIPSNGQSRVRLATPIMIVFSEPMDGTSVEENFTMAGVSGTFAWNGAGDTLTFTPSGLLTQGTDYTVIISSDATNDAGVPMESNVLVSFSTIHLWTHQINGDADESDNGYGIALDDQNNVYVTGALETLSNNKDVGVWLYNSEGTLQWEGSYDGSDHENDYGIDIFVDAVGNFYVSGYITDDAGFTDIWARKYLPSHAIDWTFTYDGDDQFFDYGYSIAADTDGSVYIGGSIYVNSESENAWLRKMDKDKVEIWTEEINGPDNGNDGINSVALGPDGSVYVTGDLTTTTNSSGMWTRKYSSDGTEEWSDTYDGNAGSTADIGMDIAVDDEGSAYVAGFSYTDSTTKVGIVRKYSSSGDHIWTTTFSGDKGAYNTAHGVAVDADHNVYVTGDYEAGGGYSNIVVIKMDPDGDILWTEQAAGAVDGGHKGRDIAVDDQGNSYVVGEVYNGDDTKFDVWIRVFDTDGNWAE